MDKVYTLGIIGGVGPIATSYFDNMLLEMTYASKDQDYIPLIVLNDSQIPDRTAYILDDSKENPLPHLIKNAKILDSLNVDYIAMPCNTAHYFYEGIQSSIKTPIINIIEEAVSAATKGKKGLKIGVLATEGTIKSHAYRTVIEKYECEEVAPDDANQKIITEIIYDQVKARKRVNILELLRIIGDLRNDGCDYIILGCTELSVINQEYKLTSTYDYIIDSMEELAKTCIKKCGKKVKSLDN